MKYKKLYLVRGYDLFFSPVSAKSLENMGKQLGGKYSFDAKKFRITRALGYILYIKPDKLCDIHEIADWIGAQFSLTYGCQYYYCEFYLINVKFRISEA